MTTPEPVMPWAVPAPRAVEIRCLRGGVDFHNVETTSWVPLNVACELSGTVAPHQLLRILNEIDTMGQLLGDRDGAENPRNKPLGGVL